MTDQPRPKGGRNQSVKRKNGAKPPVEEPGTALWKKVLFVSVGVLFVFLMVASSMGTSWLNIFQTVEAGDVVLTDVTIRDDQSRPILTTSETVYQSAAKENRSVFLTSPFALDAGLPYNESMKTVPITAPSSGYNYTLFGEEYDAITMGVVGMHSGSTKSVSLKTNVTQEQNYTAEEFERLGGDFANATVGDEMVLSFVENMEALYDNTTTPTYALRTTHVVNKTDESVMLSFAHATADLTVSRVRSS
jgi:hypothetical protein